jgi:hypothetical protein
MYMGEKMEGFEVVITLLAVNFFDYFGRAYWFYEAWVVAQRKFIFVLSLWSFLCPLGIRVNALFWLETFFLQYVSELNFISFFIWRIVRINIFIGKRRKRKILIFKDVRYGFIMRGFSWNWTEYFWEFW